MLRISRTAVLAAALAFGMPLGAGAQDVKLSVDGVVNAGFTTTVSVPTVLAVGSSMDETALRESLSGGFLKHAAEVAALDAASITIPEISVSSTEGSETKVFKISDIVLANVTDGVAASVTIGGLSSHTADGGVDLGKISANALDFATLLAIIGVAGDTSAGQPLKTLYKDINFAGGTFGSDKFKCTLGPITAAEVKGRPLAVSFAQFMESADALGTAGDNPPLELVGTQLRFYADLMQAFESAETTFDGLACAGTGDDGKPVDFKIGKMSASAGTVGATPAFAIEDLVVTSNDSTVTFGRIDLKTSDYRGTVKTLEAAAADPNLSPKWFEQNARLLTPEWGGLTISDVSVEGINPVAPGEKVSAKLASFDVSLADYINGIPSKLSLALKGLSVPVPQDTTNPQMGMMLALGITELDFGFELEAAWDGATQTLLVNKVGLDGTNLAGIAFAAAMGNAQQQLFDLNPESQQMAGLSLTAQQLQLFLRDDGLGNILAQLFADPNVDKTLDDVRTRYAGMLEGLSVATFGSTDSSRALGAAVGNFVSGKAKSLLVTLSSNDPAGIPLMALMQSQDDPRVLAPLITVTGVAE